MTIEQLSNIFTGNSMIITTDYTKVYNGFFDEIPTDLFNKIHNRKIIDLYTLNDVIHITIS